MIKISEEFVECGTGEESALFAAARAGNGNEKLRAMSEIVEKHSSLVISIAKLLGHLNLPQDDLVAEGYLGLMRAAVRYDPRAPASFRTYASYWVRQAMYRAASMKADIVRIPAHTSDRVRKLEKAETALGQKLRRKPRTSELARELGVSEKVARRLRRSRIRVVSTQRRSNPDETRDILDYIPSDCLNPRQQLLRKESETQLKDKLESLPEKERKILRLRFGLTDGRSWSLDAIGRKMGLSRERVRQIQNAALGKLRFELARAC